jgi:tripartite ATP-independent transporter DctP family solute receptor
MGYVFPTADDAHRAAERFRDRVRDLTSGEIKINLFPGGQLGSPTEMAEQVKNGVLDFAILSTGQLADYAPQVASIQLPFTFDTPAHAHAVLDNEGGELLKPLIRRHNFEPLAFFELGFRAISNSKRPINSVADMRGLRIRVPPELAMESSMRALGAIPIQMNFNELYMALSQRVVDGQENPVRYIYSNRFHEQQKFIAVPGNGYMYLPLILVMSKPLYDRLSETQRSIVGNAAAESRDWLRSVIGESERKARVEMEKVGIQFTSPDVKEFRQAIQPAREEMARKIGVDFVEKWLSIVDRRR